MWRIPSHPLVLQLDESSLEENPFPHMMTPPIPILPCKRVGLCMCVLGFLCGVLVGLHSGRKFTMEDVWSSFHSGAGKVVKYVQAIKESSMFHLNRESNRRVSTYRYLLRNKYPFIGVCSEDNREYIIGRMKKDKQRGCFILDCIFTLLHSSPEGMQSIIATNCTSCPTII